MRHSSPLLLLGWLLVLSSPSLAAGTHPGQVVGSFPVPAAGPTGLVVGKTSFWVLDRVERKIFQVDLETGKVLASLEAPCLQPFGLARDEEGRLWVGSDFPESSDDHIYRLDPSTGVVDRVIPSPVDGLRSLAWDGKALWVGTRRKTLVEVDPVDGSVLKTSPPPSNSVSALTFDGTRLWSGDRRSDSIYLVDRASGEVIFSFPAPGPRVSGLSFREGILYVLDYQDRRVYQVRTRGERAWWTWGGRRVHLCYRVVQHNRGDRPAELLTTWIALPREDPRQKILSPIRWTPAPAGFDRDEWGNRFARFEFARVAPGKSVEARMDVDLELRNLRRCIYPEQVEGLEQIPQEVKDKYLADGTKFQLGDPFLKKLAGEAAGGEKNPWWIARKLARAVGERTSYELSGGWEPAPVVLKRGSGSCSEYTFAFIALCREAGLPARFAGSVVVRGEDGSFDDVFHRWAQVYLPPFGWVDWDVQAADSPVAGRFAESLCVRGDRYLVTTLGGGLSRVLKWEYNSQTASRTAGRSDIVVEKYGEWSPLKE